MSDSPFHIDLQDIKDAATKGSTEIVEFMTKRVFTNALATVPQIVAVAQSLPNEFWLVASSMSAGALQAGPTAFGGDALKRRVWNMALNAGVVGFGRAMGTLSDADMQARGDTAREAARTKAVTESATYECFVVDGTAHPVVSRDSADNPLCTCTVFDAAARTWRGAHSATVRPPAARGGAPTPVPDTPLPVIPLSFTQVKTFNIPECPCLAASLIAAPKPADSPKAKTFEETLNHDQLVALDNLVDAAINSGIHGRLYVEAAKADDYGKVRGPLGRFLTTVGTAAPSRANVERFVRILDGGYRINPKDALEHGVDVAISAGMRNSGGIGGAISGLFGHLGQALTTMWRQVNGPLKTAVVAYVLTFVLSAAMLLVGVGNDWWPMAAVGSVMVFVLWLILIPVQKTVDWTMDQARIIGSRFGLTVDSSTNSIEWLFKLARDAGVWVIVFGFTLTAMTHMGWPFWIRVATAFASVMPVARALYASGRPSLAESVERTEKTNYAILGIVGVVIVLVEILDHYIGRWSGHLTGFSVGSFDSSLPWWSWIVAALVLGLSAVFADTFLTPKIGERDTHRSIRAVLVFVLAVSALAGVVAGVVKGVDKYWNDDAPQASHQSVQPATPVDPPPATASSTAPKVETSSASTKVSVSAPPKTRHAKGTRMFSDEVCDRKTRTSDGYSACQRLLW